LWQVRAALLLGHRHADQNAGFVGGGARPRIVSGRQDLGQPGAGQRGRITQRRGGCEGHGKRAADATFYLIEQEGGRRAHHMGAGPAIPPGQRVHLLGHGTAKQLMPGGVELDFVDAMAETVMAAQLRRVAIGLLAEPDRR
jgi:hypothetical protein